MKPRNPYGAFRHHRDVLDYGCPVCRELSLQPWLVFSAVEVDGVRWWLDMEVCMTSRWRARFTTDQFRWGGR